MAHNVIVLDNGTGYVKAGFAGDNLPRFSFPSIIGRPVLRAEEEDIGDITLKDIMIGDEAAALRRALEITHPVENGVIRNWGDMELVWRHLFTDKMGFREPDLGSKKILLTEAPLNPKENRRKMVESMFEKFGFGACQIGVQAMLTLYAQGLMTGLVLDAGDGVTHVVAVYDGYVPQHLTTRLDVAGRHVTRYLTKLLLLRGYAFNRTADFQTVQEIKEKLCYVAMEPAKDRKLALETTVLMEKYTLPDGRVIQVGRERFEAPECLFDPSLVGVETPGMADLVFDTIMKADMDMRTPLFQNIVLSGGSTMYPGLPSRLEHDLKARYLKDVLKGAEERLKKFKLNVEDPPRRKHMVFLGAATLGEIMASRSEFWMTKQDYAEMGAARLVDRFSTTR